MALIPAGRFVMGSNAPDQVDETPHTVYVSAFYIDVCEVTQEDYQRVMNENPSRRKTDKTCPVDQVRWPKAAAYCNARSRLEGLQEAYDPKTWACNFAASGYRLPTEAEWERACRGGSTTAYSFGDNPADLERYAWFKDNCPRWPRPAGQKQPNPFGLHDVHGNVWEWCNDFYAEDTYSHSPERDPTGPKSGNTRVVRGGYWNSRADHCRSSYREHQNPGYTDVCFGAETHGFVGFRCVRRAD
jgi:formylglycine-generating enzyme required for sulfatase activity